MQLTDHLHQLSIPFSVPTPLGDLPRSVNLWLLVGECIVVIDSGVAGSERRVAAYLQGLGRSVAEIDWLLLTHSHPDHIGAAAALVELSGCQVAAHAAERDWIEDPQLQARQRPVPGFAGLVQGAVAVTRELDDGEVLKFDGLPELTVLHTPGHSRGSLSLWAAQAGWLVSGDAIPVPGDLPIFDDFAAARAALQRLRACTPQLLLSSWQEEVRGPGAARRLEAATAWLEQLATRVRQEAPQVAGDPDPLAFCRRLVPRLGLPAVAVNPLVARSLAACLAPHGEE